MRVAHFSASPLFPCYLKVLTKHPVPIISCTKSYPVLNREKRNEKKRIPRRMASGRGTQWPQLHCTLGRRVTRIPGSTHGARSRHSSPIFSVRVQGIDKSNIRETSKRHRHSRLSREKSVTHFGLPTSRALCIFLSHLLPRGNEIPSRGWVRSRGQREKVKESRRKFTLHVRDSTWGNYYTRCESFGFEPRLRNSLVAN